MTQTQASGVKTEHTIKWEKLPVEYQLPDDPVENLYHPLLAAALREILELAGFITVNMLIASNFGLCANVNGRIIVKAPDWVYVPAVFPVPIGIICRSYTAHAEGEVPAVVMEFLSETEQGEYSINPHYPYGKLYFYEQILQVPNYVIFEPVAGILEVRSLDSGRYVLQQPDTNGRYWIESMNLFFGAWYGTKSELTGNWLRWWDSSGNLLLWGEERVLESLQKGIQQGIQQGKLELIMRLLTRKIGTVEPHLQSIINGLSAADLDELSEALLDFTEVSALSTWLEQR